MLSPALLPVAPAQMIVGIEQQALLRVWMVGWISAHFSEHKLWIVDGAGRLADRPPDEVGLCVLCGTGSAEWFGGEIKTLRRYLSDVPVAVFADAALEPEVARFDIQGFIPFATDSGLATAAMRLLMAGGEYFRPMPSPSPARAIEAGPHAGILFTPRELTVVDLLASGTPNKLIAHRLQLSTSTVKQHVHNILGKLQVSNRAQAAVMARAVMRQQSDGRGMR